MHRRLVIFISSASDLSKYRDAVEKALLDLDTDGERFEVWPALPVGPMDACIREVDESDALVLVLGANYGTVCEAGISFTHLEYRRALELAKPIFVFRLDVVDCDQRQSEFIAEVERQHVARRGIKTATELGEQVRHSLLYEFTRCFRHVHAGPPLLPTVVAPTAFGRRGVPDVGHDREHARTILRLLYDQGDDDTIRALAPQCELRFSDDLEITNLIYMADVNAAMNGVPVVPQRLERIIAFWSSEVMGKVATPYSLAYCQANVLSAMNRDREAIEYYKKALAFMPGFAECWKNLGTSYLQTEEQELARQCFKQALDHQPRLFNALYSLGNLSLQEDKDPAQCIAYMDQIALSGVPPARASGVHGWKALAFEQLGKYQEAVECIELALAAGPDLEWPWMQAARLYSIARRAEKKLAKRACGFWERFVSRKEGDGAAWAELGYCYWFLGGHAERCDFTRRAIVAFTAAADRGYVDNGLVWDRLGHLFKVEGNEGAAEEAYRKAAALNAADFGYCLGACLMGRGNYAEAATWLRAAAEGRQADGMSWSNLAICYERLGRFDEAVSAHQKAIQVEPEYAPAWFHLGGIYSNAGRRSDAKSQWLEAIKRFPDHELAAKVRTEFGIAIDG